MQVEKFIWIFLDSITLPSINPPIREKTDRRWRVGSPSEQPLTLKKLIHDFDDALPWNSWAMSKLSHILGHASTKHLNSFFLRSTAQILAGETTELLVGNKNPIVLRNLTRCQLLILKSTQEKTHFLGSFFKLHIVPARCEPWNNGHLEDTNDFLCP